MRNAVTHANSNRNRNGKSISDTEFITNADSNLNSNCNSNRQPLADSKAYGYAKATRNAPSSSDARAATVASAITGIKRRKKTSLSSQPQNRAEDNIRRLHFSCFATRIAAIALVAMVLGSSATSRSTTPRPHPTPRRRPTSRPPVADYLIT